MKLTFVGKDPNSSPTGCCAPSSAPAVVTQHRAPDGRSRRGLRWVPRRSVSSIGIPGNDFYLIDDRLVVFLIYRGNGLNADYQTSTESADIHLCRSAFDAAWRLAIPHSDYQPA